MLYRLQEFRVVVAHGGLLRILLIRAVKYVGASLVVDLQFTEIEGSLNLDYGSCRLLSSGLPGQ